MSEANDQIVLVFGTRPEIIKIAPVIRECQRRDLPFTLVHTGQHYSDPLDTVFFRQLDLPEPDRQLAIGSGSHGKQTGAMLTEIESALLELPTDVVLVQGDTNSTVAGALAAAKLDVTLAHIEAGLRSFDRTMPEELNRIIADHVSDLLFAPTDHAADTLKDEGIPGQRTCVTGNTVVDAIHHNTDIADRNSTALCDLALDPDGYLLVTAHRPANVDDPHTFENLLHGVNRVAKEFDRPAIYPIHPRAKETLTSANIEVPESIRTIDPVGYFDFLALLQAASLVLTDSGGVQEEACILEVPCVTMRDSTERPETLAVGANTLVGTDSERILGGAREMTARPADWPNPFGDGDAAGRILDVVAGRVKTEVIG